MSRLIALTLVVGSVWCCCLCFVVPLTAGNAQSISTPALALCRFVIVYATYIYHSLRHGAGYLLRFQEHEDLGQSVVALLQ